MAIELGVASLLGECCRKRVPVQESNLCTGPEVASCLVCSGILEEACMA